MGSLKDDLFVKSLSNMVIKKTIADADRESGNENNKNICDTTYGVEGGNADFSQEMVLNQEEKSLSLVKQNECDIKVLKSDIILEDVDEDECSLIEASEFIAQLPDELWLLIFRGLTTYELCTLGLVSRDMLRLSRDPVLWTHVSLLGDALGDTPSVVKLFSRCSSLQHVSITSRDDISDIIATLSSSCHNLSSLQIKFCQPLTFNELSQLASGCSKLRKLDLEGTGCLNSDGDSHEMEGSTPCQCGPSLSFTSLLATFKHLSELNLFHCRNLHSAGLEHIAQCCHSLEKLNIDEVNYLSDESVNTFLKLRGANMKMLWIDGESLSDVSFSNFYRMEKLELLSVSFSDNIGADGLIAISQLSKLEWLRLRRGSELEPADFVTAFFDGKLNNLLHLDLSECSKIDDAGIIAIAHKCPNLGSLTLSWCWEVTDVGISFIVNKCKYIINLNLCGVVRLLGDFIPSIPKSLIGLQLLDLEQCPDIQLAELQQLLLVKKELHIKDYYGERVVAGRIFGDFDIVNNLIWSSDDEV